ncbi:MAG TPA: sigma factor-like helix-turn-helix DNA-binding protein [Myxococcales bacterium LLY-WYZ-16_1]|nr:sigma factor-like helix-turn-helix DNA-binding protein [Myxococcales bacterium LLY-WYZ-16_1]
MNRPPKGPREDRSSVPWSDSEDEAWHDDSSLPASSELPEEIEAPSVVPDPQASQTPEEAATEPPEPGEDHADTEVPPAFSESARQRSMTIPRKQMLRDRRRMLSQGTLPEILEYDRPRNRAECRHADRPCLYVSCRYHLYLDVNPATGSIKINFPDKQIWELEETCALDVAERGGVTLEEVGVIMNLTRERIRQVEVTGLEKLRGSERELETFLDGRELPVHRDSLPILGRDPG